MNKKLIILFLALLVSITMRAQFQKIDPLAHGNKYSLSISELSENGLFYLYGISNRGESGFLKLKKNSFAGLEFADTPHDKDTFILGENGSVYDNNDKYYFLIVKEGGTVEMVTEPGDLIPKDDEMWYKRVGDTRVYPVMVKEYTAFDSLIDHLIVGLRDKDSYRFNEYGQLAEFSYTMLDGTILHVTSSYEDQSSSLLEFSYPDGRYYSNRIVPAISPEVYEKLLQEYFPAPELYDLMRDASFYFESWGIQVVGFRYRSPCVVTESGIRLDGFEDKYYDEKGNLFKWKDDPRNEDSYILNFDGYTVRRNGCYETSIFEEEEKSYFTITFDDGTFFKGKARPIRVAQGGHPYSHQPWWQLVEPFNEFTQDAIVNGKRVKVYLGGFRPTHGEVYDENGNLIRIIENENLWYDANSDGTVYEVYVDGKPMASGFARDKAINEYNGALKARADKLKAEEEAARKKAEQKAKEREETEKRIREQCKKYGESYVLNYLNGKIIVGAPEEMLMIVNNGFWRPRLIETVGNHNHYLITVLDLGSLSNRYISVWCRNGKVYSVKPL